MKEKIGQMLMLGFRGTFIEKSSVIADDLREGRCGGVILFDKDMAINSDTRNIINHAQVKKLNAEIAEYSKTTPFIAIDQEGGKVARLSEERGFPKTVTAKFLGDQDNPSITAEHSAKMAELLSELGFNLNFTPCLDLIANPDCPIIAKKDRSFSADPNIVAKHAEIVIDKHREKKILCAGKHFPGHGSSISDSHIGFTDVTNTWNENELYPHELLIKCGKLQIIMTAHIYNKLWDSKYPATLSKNVVTKMLREKINYDGVVITDDMSMGAITNNYGLEEAIKNSINAGCDILLFANTANYNENIATEAIEIIEKHIENGEIKRERIEQSYNRIVQLKQALK